MSDAWAGSVARHAWGRMRGLGILDPEWGEALLGNVFRELLEPVDFLLVGRHHPDAWMRLESLMEGGGITDDLLERLPVDEGWKGLHGARGSSFTELASLVPRVNEAWLRGPLAFIAALRAVDHLTRRFAAELEHGGPYDDTVLPDDVFPVTVTWERLADVPEECLYPAWGEGFPSRWFSAASHARSVLFREAVLPFLSSLGRVNASDSGHVGREFSAMMALAEVACVMEAGLDDPIVRGVGRHLQDDVAVNLRYETPGLFAPGANGDRRTMEDLGAFASDLGRLRKALAQGALLARATDKAERWTGWRMLRDAGLAFCLADVTRSETGNARDAGNRANRRRLVEEALAARERR